jgi:hypothetical protein
MPSGVIETDDVKREGREAFLNGKTVYANPHTPSTIAAVYWRKGFLAAQEEAEIAEQEASGHFRDRLAT